MKIGIVTTWFERGAAYVSKEYVNALRDGNEVFIYARGFKNGPENENWDQDYVHWGKKSLLPVPMAIDKKDFVGWIKQNNLDTVFFNEQQWWPPVLWARESGVTTGAYIDYYTEETIPLFGVYDFLICNTKRHFEAFAWHPQATYIPWGTDTALFQPNDYDPVSDSVTFFQSCGYSPVRKGTDFVIKAFSRITKPSKLIIHTQVDLKSAIPDQKDTIDELVKKGRLEIIEKTVSAPGLYHLGDVYVAPSRLEGIGLTAAEAISCGLPFITTDFPPMNEFVTEESGRIAKVDRLWARKDGYYWPQCRPVIDDLRYQMEHYIENQDLLTSYKKNARSYAETFLDWKKNSKELDFSSFKQLEVSKELINKVESYERQHYGRKLELFKRFPLLTYLMK